MDVRSASDISANFGNITGSLPYSVIMDIQGNIIARKLGALTLSELENILKPYMNN